MSFNNGLERKKFENTWKKLRMDYAAAGMSKADIEEMYQFDLDMFRSERRYAEHTQGMPFQKFDDGDTAGEGNSALLMKLLSGIACAAERHDPPSGEERSIRLKIPSCSWPGDDNRQG